MKYIVNQQKSKVFAFAAGCYILTFNNMIKIHLHDGSEYVLGTYNTEEITKSEFDIILRKLADPVSYFVIYL